MQFPCNPSELREPYACESACGKLLSCSRHQCESTCHAPPCPPCAVTEEQRCYCGQDARAAAYAALLASVETRLDWAALFEK
jgi:hypothetical protein